MTSRQKFWVGLLVISVLAGWWLSVADPDTPKPRNAADVRFGLSEEQRFQAWLELRDAFDATPEITSDREAQLLIDEQISHQVEVKYGLTSKQMDKILIEGYEKKWNYQRRARYES